MRKLPHLADLPITGKLVLIVLVFLGIIGMLGAMVVLVLKVHSGARAYINGESLWSKGQKEAVYYLTLYSLSPEEEHYRRFREALEVPLGDARARAELLKPDFDRSVAVEGLLAGGNHPDDIPSMIFLFRWFGSLELMARPIEIWGRATDYVVALGELGAELRREVEAGKLTAADRRKVVRQIEAINARVTPLEREFSNRLTESAHRLRTLTLELLGLATIVLLASGLLVSLLVGRRLGTGILRLRDGATQFARGELTQPILIDSRDELGELADAFNDMIRQRRQVQQDLEKARDAALQASRAKSEFLSSMSHEIRTPMNAIIGLSDLLSETGLDDDQRAYVERLSNAGNALVNLISDILDLSRIEAGRLELEESEFDLRDLVEKTVEIFQMRAGEKGLRLTCQVEDSVPARLVGDPGRLRQILVNLLGNAVKFTDRGTVRVRVERASASLTGMIRFSISDTGIGIPPDKQATIFEPFTQAATSTTRQYGGSGLGLTICRRLVERMHGGIWVESREGEGSTFTFTVKLRAARDPVVKPLPVPPPDAPRPDAPRVESHDRREPLRVLLAEDSEDNRMLIQTYFRRSTDLLEIAENGAIALEKFKSGSYDLVLMDMQMPVMNGYDATRAIREWEKSEGRDPVPIIALTAYALKEERERSLASGCTLYLTKPIKKATLMEAIQREGRGVERQRGTG